MVSNVSGVRLAKQQEKEINFFVRNGMYLSVSDFIREAVRDKLEAMKVVQIREDVSRSKAKKEILNYLARNPGAYTSDISEALRIDLDLIFAVLEELKKEGVVE